MQKVAPSNTTNNITSNTTTSNKGFVFALSAFLIWSCFPLYFKQLQAYDAIEIIVHRIIWTFVLLLLLLAVTRPKSALARLKQEPKWLFLTFVSGFLIASNWLTYVWSVNNNQIIEASLGYFMSPLAGVALSFFVLKEPLRPLQRLALMAAVLGVLWQIVLLGSVPMVSLILALTFSVYGLVQRKTPLDSITALFIETALLVPFCLVWLLLNDVASSQLGFWWSSHIWLLMLAGPITLIPLLLYNKSTKLVNFNTLSFMNYLPPTLILLMAIMLYQEPFHQERWGVFGLIWCGLILFSIDMWHHRKPLSRLSDLRHNSKT